jgi:hypothetical protein
MGVSEGGVVMRRGLCYGNKQVAMRRGDGEGVKTSRTENGNARSSIQGPGFRIQDSGFRVQGSGFRVQGSKSRVQGPGSRVQCSGFRV